MIKRSDLTANVYKPNFVNTFQGSTFYKNIRMEIKIDGSVNYDLDKYQDFNVIQAEVVHPL
ncbi:hypothetical protein [Enterococcus cecorum]|uniref:hypothetical protein n=1 Tax=Enterococcus cecorum TaxID=44008 RepID=UPI0013A63BA3|nr:hypothetical protein [Enterococcus cecorum]